MPIESKEKLVWIMQKGFEQIGESMKSQKILVIAHVNSFQNEVNNTKSPSWNWQK